MKSTNNGTGIKLWAAALCGVLSVLIDFILIPQIFSLPPMLGLPDPIWMSMMILLPVLIAIHMLGQKAHLPAEYVWVGLPVQYVILIILRNQFPELEAGEIGHTYGTQSFGRSVSQPHNLSH